MITNIEFPTETARPGELRRLVVEGAAPIRVEIRCFTQKPPPPGFKGCPECGVLSLGSGEPHLLKVPTQPFAAAGGELHILLRDALGDAEQLTIAVASFDQGMTGEKKPVPGTGSPGERVRVIGTGVDWQPLPPPKQKHGETEGVLACSCS